MSEPRRPRAWIRTVVQIAIVLVIFVGAFAYNRYQSTRPEPVAEATPSPLPSGFFQATDLEWRSLRFATVGVHTIAKVIETEGTIAPADDMTTQVFSPVTGRVVTIFATVGDRVVKGEPLFIAESSELVQGQNDLATATQTLASSRVALRVAQTNRARLLKLLPLGGAARKDVDQSAADLATAEAAVRNNEVALSLVRGKLALLGQNPAAVEKLEKQNGAKPFGLRVTVPSPLTGVVTTRSLGVGQYVDSSANGSSNALFTISDFSRVFLTANLREADVGRVGTGDAIAVRFPGFPDRVFDATVRYIAPTVDATTHRIFARAEVANPDGLLKPGMYGSFRISEGTGTTGITVPEDAVVYEGSTARVWVTGPHKLLAIRPIRVGTTTDGSVEVLSGLRVGERVVTSGSVFIDRAGTGGD